MNSGFNDAVGIWVNGEPAELTFGSGNISIDEINDQTNENLYIDNPANAEEYNTEMDGFTVTLTLKAKVNPGEENTIKIGIADGGDTAYDSNLLIAGDSVQTSLVAGDDDLVVTAGTKEEFDLLSNDSSSTGSTLTITAINGQPVSVGSTVELATGEVITVTDTGLVLADPDGDLGSNSFTYTVEDEDGNSDVGFVNLTKVAPCFTSGTRILTPIGPVLIEQLSPGDLVLTLDHGPRPLKWIGITTRRAEGKDAPVHFAKGTLGQHDALELSPQHRVLFAAPEAHLMFGTPEVLMKAKDFEGEGSICRRRDCRSVTYVHLLFDQHEIVCGNGLWSESYQPGSMSADGFDLECQDELLRLFPKLYNPSAATGFLSARLSLKWYEARALIEKSKQAGTLAQSNYVQSTKRQPSNMFQALAS